MIRRLAIQWACLRTVRCLSLLSADALAAVCALWAALLLRLDGRVAPEIATAARMALPVLVSMRLLAVVSARLHRWSFTMSGLSEAARLGVATLAGSAGFVLIFHSWSPLPLPRSVYVLEFFLTLTLMTAYRFAPRVVLSWYGEQRRRDRTRTVIVGAGNAGDLLARDLVRSGQSRHWVAGFVDDDPAKLHTFIAGKPVLGRIADLPAVLEAQQVETVLLAIPGLPASRVREILDVCSRSSASFKIMPASFRHMDAKVSAAILNELAPEDLLPRGAVSFDPEEIRRLVAGRRALVTGAGGSIGSEICRQLARHGVAELVMLDMNENELYLGARRLGHEYPGISIHAEVADIREPSRLRALGERYRPEHVFHAAAHKHVPLLEDAPDQAVKNNVFGTINVARMAHECGAERLVVISTDKAVKPTSVMGATKRVAEMAVRDLARTSRTKMTTVRFGNVLGSAGSVVHIFKEQIARGGPVTVTHPECTRYFMTIPEAVGLVLIAGLGGYGDLCVLEMGEPIRISELARSLITMAGLVPDEDIDIVYTGLRPGEKLYEQLLTEDEEQTQQVRNRIMVARSPEPPRDLRARLRDLRELAELGEVEEILLALKAIVPTYRRTLGQPLQPLQPLPVAQQDRAVARGGEVAVVARRRFIDALVRSRKGLRQEEPRESRVA
jgi:FlaA1/EpsC-like NDP-sugar epimerase